MVKSEAGNDVREGCVIEPFTGFLHELGDGMHIVILNAAADHEKAPAELRTFLSYVRKAVPENATDSFTARLSKSVDRFRESSDRRSQYMTLEMKLRDMFDEGKAEGETIVRERHQLLANALFAAGRGDELLEALSDPGKEESLWRELHLPA